MSGSAGRQRALQGLVECYCNIGSRQGAFTACLRQAVSSDGRVAHKHRAWHQAPHRQASQQLLGSSMLFENITAARTHHVCLPRLKSPPIRAFLAH